MSNIQMLTRRMFAFQHILEQERRRNAAKKERLCVFLSSEEWETMSESDRKTLRTSRGLPLSVFLDMTEDEDGTVA